MIVFMQCLTEPVQTTSKPWLGEGARSWKGPMWYWWMKSTIYVYVQRCTYMWCMLSTYYIIILTIIILYTFIMWWGINWFYWPHQVIFLEGMLTESCAVSGAYTSPAVINLLWLDWPIKPIGCHMKVKK